MRGGRREEDEREVLDGECSATSAESGGGEKLFIEGEGEREREREREREGGGKGGEHTARHTRVGRSKDDEATGVKRTGEERERWW